MGCIILHGCGGLALDDGSNESIPNYSLTSTTSEVSPTMLSDIIAIDDNTLILATERTDSIIQLIQFDQDFTNENWTINQTDLLELGTGKLLFFQSIGENYLIGYRGFDGSMNIQLIDENLNPTIKKGDFEVYIDTSYNDIDSLILLNASFVKESSDILLSGSVYTQGTSFSCLLKVNSSLEPLWIKTYFEHSEIQNVLSINRDSFLLLNANDEGTDLIRDNYNSQAYTKYDLSNDDLFLGSQPFIQSEKIYLTGIQNEIGRTIEVNLENNTSFINDIEIYPVVDLQAVYLSRNNFVMTGIQSRQFGDVQFTSELSSMGSMWCHRYTDEQYLKTLDIIEMPGKGVVVSSIVSIDSKYYIHITRIDEEGATFVNEYTENCI